MKLKLVLTKVLCDWLWGFCGGLCSICFLEFGFCGVLLGGGVGYLFYCFILNF